jgi:hypothetical protein
LFAAGVQLAFGTIKYATEEVTRMNSQSQEEPIPLMQKFLDNPFLLLFFGVMVPMVVYSLWGVIEILTVPLAK